MDVSQLPSFSEVCAALQGDTTIQTYLDGGVKGLWSIVAIVLGWAVRRIYPLIIHWFQQRFLDKMFSRLAGELLVTGGKDLADPDKLRQLAESKVAEAVQRGGGTMEKVGLTRDLVAGRILGTLGTLIAAKAIVK